MSETPAATAPQLSIKQLGDLSSAHRETLLQAIERVFSTEDADKTMAQLVDGLPLIDVFMEARATQLYHEHPIHQHKELCQGAMEKYKLLKANFDIDSLVFDEQLIRAFIKTTPGERVFSFRLIELVAKAVHAVAVNLFNLDEKFHPTDEIKSTTTSQEPLTPEVTRRGEIHQTVRFPPHKTLFFHVMYRDSHQYPNGVADNAGFWAEDWIFGGVFLFDRGESGTESKDVFMHSGRREWTVRVWRLLDTQLDAVMDFFTREADDPAGVPKSPFPLFGDEKNLYRFDDYDAMAWHNIYRDRWERELPPEKNLDTIRRNTFDDPGTLAMFEMVKNDHLIPLESIGQHDFEDDDGYDDRPGFMPSPKIDPQWRLDYATMPRSYSPIPPELLAATPSNASEASYIKRRRGAQTSSVHDDLAQSTKDDPLKEVRKSSAEGQGKDIGSDRSLIDNQFFP